jgi:hypothetical protein
MLLENEEYQRSVPFVLFALLVKDMYALDWELQETVRSVEDEAETGFVKDAVENGCRTVWQEHAPAYVETGKKTQEVYEAYLKALKEIILSSVEGEDDRSFYDVLNMYLPGLDRSEYKNVHRSTLEYLVKMTRKRLRREFGGKNFRGDSRM